MIEAGINTTTLRSQILIEVSQKAIANSCSSVSLSPEKEILLTLNVSNCEKCISIFVLNLKIQNCVNAKLFPSRNI